MANVLKPKRSSTASAVPTLSDLADGEIAVNSADKKFYMRVGGIIVDITPAATWNGGTVTGGALFTTAPVIVDNVALRVQNWAGTPGNGVLFFGDAATDNYIFKNGSLFRLRGGTNIVDIDCSTAGKVWHSGGTRFQADFNNSTVANRAYFQSAATNGATVVGALPNGTGTQSDFRAHSSSDPGNSTYLSLQATSTSVTILSGFFGTGTQRDINISYNGTVQQKLYADGHVEAQSYFDSKGSLAGYRLWDRTNTTHAYVLYSDLDIARLVYSGGYEYTWNSGGVFTTVQVVASGSAAALFTGDRTTTAQYALYGSAGLGRIYHSTYGDVANFDGTGVWTFANTVNIEGSIPAGYKNLVSAGANTWALGKVNMLTAGSNIGTGVAGATYMAYNNTAGNLTLTATAGVTARKAGTASVAPLTLLPRGFITIWYITTTECVCSGHLA